MAKGIVYLVGAGPGDPQLITVKGLECVREADVIIYDRLVSEKLLEASRSDAERIYAGKESARHTMSQKRINSLLIEKAKAGKTVVRLKGGDPLVLGRGGEEAEALAAEGIEFEFVPGVTAALAVPAYAGIPATHRGLSSSVAIITGHEDPNKPISSLAWDKLSTGVDTLIFLMGIENLPAIVEQLMANGRPPTTPIALIHSGTGPAQRTVAGTLADIVEQASAHYVPPPAVIIVGEVVKMREKLRWFDRKPLFGKRVLVTRSRSQASKLSRLLSEYGAESVELPVIEIQPVRPSDETLKEAREFHRYDWVIFTSVNGVEAFLPWSGEAGLELRQARPPKICAIGPATAEACRNHGLHVDYVPEEYISEKILEGLAHREISGKRILLPRAQNARPLLAEGLRRAGAQVRELAVYRTVPPSAPDSRGLQMLKDGLIDITTFTSSSTVKNLVLLLGEDWPLANQTLVACIGPVTRDTAVRYGLKVAVMAKDYTIPGLVTSIAQYYNKAGL
ncbi:MAG: uroporphyrinogen-III C-methyltransferase [Dehalococcoidia bacterium]|nr:uroporphyrinogen-III C-methyltransferase [Dehalococcoidia bacterium]